MPHIFVDKLNKDLLPSKVGGYEYLFATKGDDGLIGVCDEEDMLLLEFVKKGKQTLVKLEKTTKLSNLNKNKDVLKKLPIAMDVKLLQSNFGTKTTVKSHEFCIDQKTLCEILDPNKTNIIEVGFGSGRNILSLATKNPDKCYFGFEIHKPSIEKLLRQIYLQKIQNIFVLSTDARFAIKAIGANSIDELIVHFPVPWLKAPQRRLFNEDFILDAQRVLKKNAQIFLRTDCVEYLEYVKDLFVRLDLEVSVYKNRHYDTTSKYEAKWKRMDKNIFDLVFVNEDGRSREVFNCDFSFEKHPQMDTKLKALVDKTFVEDGFVLRFLRCFEFYNGILCKLAMGDASMVEIMYLILKDDEISYFINSPQKTQKSFLAHQKIQNLLGER